MWVKFIYWDLRSVYWLIYEASAYFLREQLGPEVDISVFEREDKLGGRINTQSIDDTK